MYRGSTPTLKFTISNIDDFTAISDIWVTIICDGENNVTFTKKLSNNEIAMNNTNKIISIILTQQETLSFNTPGIRVQLKVLLNDKNVLVSHIYKIKVEDSLNIDIMNI